MAFHERYRIHAPHDMTERIRIFDNGGEVVMLLLPIPFSFAPKSMDMSIHFMHML